MGKGFTLIRSIFNFFCFKVTLYEKFVTKKGGGIFATFIFKYWLHFVLRH